MVNFTHKFKIIGFVHKQINSYVSCYFGNGHMHQSNGGAFIPNLNSGPGLVYLAEIPIYLAILVRLFKGKNRELPGKVIEICSQFLLICLQHHREKTFDNEPISSLDNLPTEMKEIFIAYRNLFMNTFS